jgi:death on curing protein
MNWNWISKVALRLQHEESLALHGGARGVRDEGLLDSALKQPVNLAVHGEPDAAELAASYAYGLAKNHAFVDGNKRAAFLAAGLFLHINQLRMLVSQVEATQAAISLAAGEMSEPQLASWLSQHIVPRNAVHEPRKPYKRRA